MNYNETQFAELSRFEDNFRTALSTPSGWTRRISIPDQRRIKAIYTEATGERIPYTIGCGHCVLNLLKKAGKLYFVDKEMREAQAKAATASPEREAKAAAEVKAEKAVESAQKPRKTSAKKESEKTPAKTKKAAKTEK